MNIWTKKNAFSKTTFGVKLRLIICKNLKNSTHLARITITTLNRNFAFVLFICCCFNFGALAQPIISYNPTSFNANIVSCNDSFTTSLTVYNTGSTTLNFDVLDGEYGAFANLNYAYIGNLNDNSVSVLDVTTNTIIGSAIPVGTFPWRVQINPDGRFVYVSNRDDNTISVIRTSDNTVTDTITVGSRPTGIAFTPDGDFAYVGNRWDNNVMKIDCNSNTVVSTITDPSFMEPQDIVITPNGQYAYVANAGTGITVIELGVDTIVATIVSNWRASS